MDLIFLKTLGASLAFVLAHPEPRDHAPALRKNPPSAYRVDSERYSLL